MRTCFLFFCLLFSIKTTHAQYEHLLHKTYAERRPYMRNYYIRELIWTYQDSAQALKIIQDIQQTATKNNDADLGAEAALMLLNYQSDRKLVPQPILLARIDSFADAAKAKNLLWLQARMESLGGVSCFRKWLNYELAFQYYTKLYRTLQQVSKEEFPEKQICYYQIGCAYYDFSDLETAIKYLREGLNETPVGGNRWHERNMTNTIGLCYQTMGQLDSAEIYFNRAYHVLTNDSFDKPWVGIIKGNIGYNYFLRKNYTAARPLIQADIDAAIFFKDWGLAAGALSNMAAIDLAEGRLAKAENEMRIAREYISRSGQYKRLARLFPLLSKLYAAQGDYRAASEYLDSTLIVKDSLARQLNALFIVRGRQRAELEAETYLENEKRIKTMQRNLLIGFIILLFPFITYIYFQQRKKHQQQQKIKDLELERKHAELEYATRQLDDFAKNISEKEKIVQELEQKIGGIDNSEFLLQLQQSTILTDEDWRNFKQLFEQVHIGYLTRLKQKLPELSPAEIRFMVLAKLKFNNREMAAALGVSAQSIRVTRHRLLKKINLPEESSLDELVVMI